MGAALALLTLGTDATTAGAQSSAISISVEAREDAAVCAPRGSALRHERVDTAASFTLVVIAERQLCEPISAVAAIYAMPGNGVAWPQTLIERREVVIGSAGTYRITFDKTCQPAQFDVLTGDTPATIAPWGQWHGPLLFPYDLTTAFQHWAPGCAPSTPTTVAPTSTSPPGTPPPTAAPTTEAPTTVAPTTPPPTAGPDTSTPAGPDEPDPVVAPTTEVPTTDDVEVLGVATPNTPGGPPAAGPAQDPLAPSGQVAGLAFTGASSIALALARVVLLLSGVATLLYPRLRSRRYWAYL